MEMSNRRQVSHNRKTIFTRFVSAFWRWAGAVSVRTKILGMILALVLLPGIIVTLQVRKGLNSAFTEQLREQSVSIARDVAARSTDLILINDQYGVAKLLRETQENNPDVRYAFIVDAKGHVLVHTFGDGFPGELLAANSVASSEHHHTVLLHTDEGPMWDTAVPIFNGKVGIARIGLSESRMQASINTMTTRLLLTTGIVAIFGIVAGFFLTWILTRPLLDLVHVTEAMRKGDFDQAVNPWADDEIGELAKAFNTMAVDLAHAEAERAKREKMRAYYLRRIILAQEEERKRIARELHDETGQSLASLMVGLRNVETAATREQMLARLADMRAVASKTLEAVHDLALELRPSVLDDLGLVAALERYVNAYQNRFKVNIDFQSVGLRDDRLPPLVEIAVYRIVQEALTNAAKYAQSDQISVLLEKHGGQLSVIVEDDGVGFNADATIHHALSNRKLGLYGMRERAEQLGGTLLIESEIDKGTTIYLRIPLVRSDDEDNPHYVGR